MSEYKKRRVTEEEIESALEHAPEPMVMEAVDVMESFRAQDAAARFRELSSWGRGNQMTPVSDEARRAEVAKLTGPNGHWDA